MPMKSWAIRIQTIIILSLSVLLFSAVAIAKDSSGVDLSRYASAEEARLAGEQLENSHQWVEAITLYEAAIEEWKDDEGLTYALRRTRIHFGVERRYSDRSFENQLLTKGRAEALDLYEDILSRVQYEYVDSISVTRFAAHGTESLYMALKNDKFLSRNVKPGNDDGVERVRSILIKDYWNRRLETRLDARTSITSVCELCNRELGIAGTAVVMEYIFGGCNALDEYSNFLTPDRYNDLFGSIQGELVGIGIEMKGVKGRGMHLVNVLLESPAERGGLQPNDFIVEIDGTDCRDLTTDDALTGIARRFRLWAETGPSDIGMQTYRILTEAGPDPTYTAMLATSYDLHARTGHTGGNGSLMRTGPVALRYLDDPRALAVAARRISALTHYNQQAQDACALWSLAIRHASGSGELDLRAGIEFLDPQAAAEWTVLIDEAETVPPADFNPNRWVVTAFQAAWAAIRQTPVRVAHPTRHLVDALDAAIRIGDDTDTVAAIAGALLGARWGASAVPGRWNEKLHGYPGITGEELVGLVDQTVGPHDRGDR